MTRRPRIEHERITLDEFAKRIHRSKATVFRWIRERNKRRLPPGTLVLVAGHYEIDWTLYEKSIHSVN